MNLYSDPEKFGLAIVGEIEWSDGCYQFDLTVVWRDIATGALYYADDAGCSCPSPYEDTGRNDLILIGRPQDLIDHCSRRFKESPYWVEIDDEDSQRIRGAIGELVMKARQVTS